MDENKLNVAVVGAGYWGKNLVRNFATAKRCNLKYVCDNNKSILSKHKADFPFIKVLTNFDDILSDSKVEAVVIATETPAHFEMAKKAIEARKHTFVEKPLTLKTSDAKALIDLAGHKKVKLMAGHLLKYHPAVTYIKDLIENGEIGKPLYMYTQRLNLGIVRQDENTWWSLAPHDISVICYLFNSEPVLVTARGQCYLQKDIEDVVFATINFADGKFANIHCSWLDPHKTRKMTIVGSKKMITFDDMEPTEKIRIYDKTAEINHMANTYAEFISLRFGNILIPEIKSEEPLAKECSHFIDCILDEKPILSDGIDGLRVVQVLEAGQESLKNNSVPVNLADSECPGRKTIVSRNQRISIKTVKSTKGQQPGIFHT
ncbi:MAG TPA: Gfo/Idh/MocA family oxidoreductase [Sedimentisphaerales bacterium]|nr:Gfo/Idh/MocA family oxidoreductase [Sedimentisphaerales bacterium]